MHFNIVFTLMNGASHIFAVDELTVLIRIVRGLPSKIRLAILFTSKG